MAVSHDLVKAFSGLGVDEKGLIKITSQWKHEHKQAFRKGTNHMFASDQRHFEKLIEDEVDRIRREALRFKSAMVLWVMHPWERDARLLKEALTKGHEGHSVIIEIACTRTAEELLGARKAYHSLFDSSVEEDVASLVSGRDRKLLVALASAYRYEGSVVHDDIVKSEVNTLHKAIRNVDKSLPVEEDEVARILSTRSKLHIHAIYKHYKELFGKTLDEDLQSVLNSSLKVAVQCLCTPETYFSEAVDASLKPGAHEFTQEALTRIAVCQADVNMKDIKVKYHEKFGIELPQKIEQSVLGNFKEFLLTLVAEARA